MAGNSRPDSDGGGGTNNADDARSRASDAQSASRMSSGLAESSPAASPALRAIRRRPMRSASKADSNDSGSKFRSASSMSRRGLGGHMDDSMSEFDDAASSVTGFTVNSRVSAKSRTAGYRKALELEDADSCIPPPTNASALPTDPKSLALPIPPPEFDWFSREPEEVRQQSLQRKQQEAEAEQKAKEHMVVDIQVDDPLITYVGEGGERVFENGVHPPTLPVVAYNQTRKEVPFSKYVPIIFQKPRIRGPSEYQPFEQILDARRLMESLQIRNFRPDLIKFLFIEYVL